MLAEAHLSIGEIDEARAAVAEARSRIRTQGEKWCLAEVLRVEGLAHLHAGKPDEAERVLTRAIREAQAIGAATLKMRVSLALSECRQTSDRVT